MHNRSGARSTAVRALFAVWFAGMVPAFAQAPGEQAMTPEQKAQMEAWTKAMTPGKPHQELATRAGVWEGKVSMWEAPGAQPQISQARSERTMGLGGRVLVDHWQGTMMGMPFEGMGMTGYDNSNGKWWSTWSDNFSTGVMTGVGTCDADHTRGCTFVSSFTDPMTGKEKKVRSTVAWPNPDEEQMVMFDTTADGKEFKNMEIVVRRVKK
jgi:hypothetical protein